MSLRLDGSLWTLNTTIPREPTILQKFVTEREFGNRLIHCVTVEGLIALKLYALPSLYPQGKFDKASIYENDILVLLLNYTVNLSPLLKVLSKHLLKINIQEIKEVIADIQSKIQRFSRQQKRLDIQQ